MVKNYHLEVIRQLQQQYSSVAMVGDGIDDTPTLVQASVGTAGNDVPLETADVMLMADRLSEQQSFINLK